MGKNAILIGLIFIFLFPVALGNWPVERARAQTSFEPWSTPINMSRSGSTNNPEIIVDSRGIAHAIWYDNEIGYLFSRLEDGTWSFPTQADLPFNRSYDTTLLADTRGYIYAIWINGQDELSYSYVPAIGFEKKFLWSKVQILANDVNGYYVERDADGFFHLAYFRTTDEYNQPAGIYYRKGRGSGYPWTSSKLLYESRYFRSLGIDNARVRLSTAIAEDRRVVYVVWDHRPLRQVFLIKSEDGGSIWDIPRIIDGPTESAPDSFPFNLQVKAYDSNILLLWQTGLQSGIDCTQVSQFSTDYGITWTDRKVMFEKIPGCPQNLKLFQLDDGLILMATIENQVYLSAWNGVEWSDPELQIPLDNFDDPESFDKIIFRCQRTAQVDNLLFVIGCDDEGDADIWLFSRNLGRLSDWYAERVEWKAPVAITEDQSSVGSPLIVCDVSDRKHILWSQSIFDARNEADTAVYYSRQESSIWVGPNRILSSPDLRAVLPAIARDRNGKLLVVWYSSQTGLLYYSQALASNAQNSFNWSEQLVVGLENLPAESPDILVSHSGRILIVYAVRINEGRGIYVVFSDDDGVSWSQPLKVFDAVINSWYMVDQPRLAQTADGVIHVTWTRNPLQSEGNAIGFYYARSIDGGLSWTQPQLVIDDVLSSGSVVAVGNTVHRFWRGLGLNAGIWHEASKDSGNTWDSATNLTPLGETAGPFSVVVDNQGRLHMAQVNRNNLGDLGIKYLVLNGDRWSLESVFRPIEALQGQITSVAACLGKDGMFSIVYTLTNEKYSTVTGNDDLFITSRYIGAEPVEALMLSGQPQPSLVTPAEVAPITPLQPTPTAVTPAIAAPAEPVPPPSSQDTISLFTMLWATPWFGPALGLALALLVVLLAITLRVRRLRGIDRY